MKGNAIEFDYVDSKPINANDLLYRYVHTIQAPKKYNFLKYSVDKDYQKYIQIRPSDHNIEVAPEFFDFENINVVTIRDGFKGEYNLQINVTSDFPDNLRGKPIEIKLEVNTTYFDKFPGTSSDPIKSYHAYTVKVPSVYIAVPYKDGPFAGKVLYTSAQASNLTLSMEIGVDWKTDGVRYVDKETLEKMANATQQLNPYKELEKIWNTLKSNINYTETTLNKDTKKVIFDGIKKDYPLFPKIMKGQPDIAEVTLLVKSSVAQLQAGTSEPIKNVLMKYAKWNGKEKTNKGERPFIYATGAWITLRFTSQYVEYVGDGKYVRCDNQVLSHDTGGYIQVNFTLTNTGNGNSYNTRYRITIHDKVRFIESGPGINRISTKTLSNGQTELTFDLNAPINQGERKGGIIYLQYDKLIDSYEVLSPEDLEALPKELPIVKESATIMDLTQNKGENEVTQIIRTPLTFNYKKPDGALVYIDMTVSGRRSNPEVEIEPVVKESEKDNKDTVKFKISKIDYTQYFDNQASLRFLDESIVTLCDFGENKKSFVDVPNKRDTSNKEHKVLYIVQMKRKDGSLVTNRIIYNQKDFGISTAELVLIILTILCFALTGIFGFLAYKNCKLIRSNRLEKEVGTMDRLLA
jgi:hypothetical protein